MQKISFSAIGTNWSIEVFDDTSAKEWSELFKKIDERIDEFDKAYSRFRSDSLVTKISHSAGEYKLPSDGFELLSFYKNLYTASAGMFTPLIGQALSDAGYDAEYSFRTHKLSKPPAWDEAIEFEQESLNIKKPVLLDFGAAGKGYLVDIIASLIETAGLKDYVIDASGDILHRNSEDKTIKIGLENPMDSSQAIGIAELGSKSLCASAGSRRKWGNYNHIIDPKTLKSPDNIIASWVVADDTMTADGIATALFFCKPANLRMYNFSYAVLNKDMSLERSPDFPAEFFEKKTK